MGELAAYLTPDPGDGKKHPAVIWAHGGFGGIGAWLWEPAPVENDQSVHAFLEAGLVVMCPSWRAENDNPGDFELYYGEVNDLLDALRYLKQLPYVDAQRVYLAGHSTGGSLVLLAAVSSNEFRAAFSFGGAPDLTCVAEDFAKYGVTPFDHHDKNELYHRSAIHFTSAIARPTFYFEGGDSPYGPDAKKMDAQAQREGVPFKAFVVGEGTHFSILHPLTRMIVRKILADTGPECDIRIDESDVRMP